MEYIIEDQQPCIIDGQDGTLYLVLFICDNGYMEEDYYFVKSGDNAAAILQAALENLNANAPLFGGIPM